MSDLTGQTLGRYRLERSLGRGGMAEVWLARDESLGRVVAVKVILPSFAADPHFRERFLREAKVVAALDHTNILPVYDFGEQEGSPYLVMPFLDGGTLASRMVGRPFPLAQVAAWTVQLAAALDAAHLAGVLHRDVKPSNVLVGRDDRVVLADFGIAKIAEAATRLTATGTVVGTPVYMAPELARGEPASRATDLYALAVMVYELLVGRPPFGGENSLSILHQHLTKDVPPPTSQISGLPPSVDPLLRRALAKDPMERPLPCASFAGELWALVPESERGGLGTGPAAHVAALARPRTASAAATGRIGTDPSSAPTVLVASDESELRRTGATGPRPAGEQLAGSYSTATPRRGWVGLAAASAVLLVVAGWFALGPPSRSPSPSAVPPASIDASQSSEPTTAAKTAVATTSAPATAAGSTPASLAPDRNAPRDTPTRAATAAPASGPGAAPNSVLASLPTDPTTLGTSTGAPPTTDATPADAGGLLAARRPPTGKGYEQLIELWRPTRRLDREDFVEAERWATGAEAPRMGESVAESGGRLARAGLLFLDGDIEGARQRIAALHPDTLGGFPVAFPLLVPRGTGTTPRDWELALALGDPRREARALLTAAPDVEAGRRRFALAIVERLDGRHEEAAVAVADLWRATSGVGESARLLRTQLAQFAAEEHALLGQAVPAREWFERAIAIAPETSQRGLLALEGAIVFAQRLGDLAVARGFLESACTAGIARACAELRKAAVAQRGAKPAARLDARPVGQRMQRQSPARPRPAPTPPPRRP